jgi:V/A-type H+-transporting ATPase subunit C
MLAPGSGGTRVAETAKARIRRASLLRNEDFKFILEQTSVSDVAVRLGQTSYAPILKGASLESMRRSELEFLLGASILAEGVAFRHYAGLRDKQLLELWLENFDIELFKNYLRHKAGTGKWEDHLDSAKMMDLVSDYHLTLVDKEKLASSNTLREMAMSLKSERLRAAMLEAIPSGGENADVTARDSEFQRTAFALGMTLDRYYFNNLYTASAELGGAEGHLMRMLVGTRVDLMNFYWIYRARRFFNMSPEEALTLIMKVRYHANFELLTKAAFAEPFAWGAVLADTPYARVFGVEETNAALREVDVECNIYRFLSGVVERVFLSGALGFQNVAAYLTLRELEVRDLIAIVEAVRYGFDRNNVGRLLVRTLQA